ncbi:hypothetical protein QTL95_22475 [Rhizobium sp. S152]|uniref:hypothetical protein n=1 Tax=Rhizobium sp. S152 TaxID=3055038 RepID=UPI0025AA1081|nr:hypothetical protein [Rhizobium sp. S152]MDM9628663.1 hypothetical protein [Rhizobium sp. S152]
MSTISLSDSGSAVRETPLWRMFLFIYGTALAMVLLDVADGVPFVGDVDDRLRELQIRSLMSAQGHWFDLSLPFVSMPEAYVSPWSRLVDLPYVVIAWLSQPWLPTEQALSLAFHIWPPIMLAIFSLLAAAAVRRLMSGLAMSGTAFSLSLALMTMLMSIGVLEFSPGRIDHHNVQIIALMMIFGGLVRWDRLGGLMVGAGAAISTVIGLECLPFVTIVYAGLVACHIAGVGDVRRVIVPASVSMIVVSIVSAVAFLGPIGAFSTQCDAFSAPYIVLLCGFSLMLGTCAALQGRGAHPVVKLLSLAVPGALLLGAAALIFPSCLAGPYGIIDPLSRALWFDRIWQEKSILYFYEGGRYNLLVLLGLTTSFAILALPFPIACLRKGQYGPAIAYLMAAGALVLTLLVTRNIRFPMVFLPIFLPAVVAMYTGSRAVYGRICGLAALGLIALFVLGRFWFPPVHKPFDAIDYMAGLDCKGQDFSALASVPAGRIALPQGLALQVAFAAPPGFSVGAIPFHRASPGMRRMYETFLTSDAVLRRQALAPFDYLAVCAFPYEIDGAQAPLYAALMHGGGWPGLEPVASAAPSDFKLFRIDHAALQ